MSDSPKTHEKLKKQKNATVSLDSLLGLLSSAYGTEEIDSKTVFEENTVNWRNLSVESFKCATKKSTEGEKIKKLKQKVSDKTHVATSTTNLKTTNSSETDIDITLVSIKSLEGFKYKLSNNKSEINDQNKTSEECKQNSQEDLAADNLSVLSDSGVEPIKSETGILKTLGDNCDVHEIKEEQCQTICGFYVDDANQKLVFDIKLTKKISQSEIMPSFQISEPEISINVTDIAKLTQSSFQICKSNLISKMQYFADVDKEFGLQNVDVNIKCNLSVFQWIIQWVQADIVMCQPCLNTTNLKPVFSMAFHLGMNRLVEDCLDFFHLHFMDVLKIDSEIENLLDDDLFLKLVKRFSNSDIEKISDDFDGFKTKLFITLIKLLVDPNPWLKVGHFSTLATIFQCENCEKLLHFEMKDLVPCRSDCNQMNFNGFLIPLHQNSSFWDLSKYIELIYSELKNWRLVYWRLWGLCHFLNCSVCKKPYPLCQSDWCPFHPAEVDYFPMNQNLSYPIGMYACCGEKAFRFNALQPYGGCKFNSHVPIIDNEEKKRLYELFQTHKDLISCPPVENSATKKFVKLIRKSDEVDPSKDEISLENYWWKGVLLAPKEKKDYSLIPQEILNRLRNRCPIKTYCTKHKPLTYGTFVAFGGMPPLPTVVEKPSISTVEVEIPVVTKNKKKPKVVVKKSKSSSNFLPVRNKMKKKKLSSFGYQPTESVWISSDTNKDNQDNQRDFEEIAMRNLVKILSPPSTVPSGEPIAGSYIRLESDWWQEHCTAAKSGGLAKNSGTVVNRTFPLSWFRKVTL